MNENKSGAAAAGSNGAAADNNDDQFPSLEIQYSPFILASLHGVYDLTKEPTKFTVPPNVHIFETQTIGDYCLTAMDRPLWNVIRWRDAFVWYFTGTEGLGPGFNDKTDEEARRVFQHLHYYAPGDTIYNRLLSIGGGRTSNGGSARTIYKEMGFYRFDFDDIEAGASSSGDDDLRIVELEPLRTKLLGDQDESVSYREFIEDFMAMNPDLNNGVVFIFSCCANFWKEDGDGRVVPKKTLERRIKLIEQQQRDQDLKLAGLTTAGPGGAGTAEVRNLPPSRNILERRGVKGRAAFAPEEADAGVAFSANADPGFEERMNMVSHSRAPPAETGNAIYIANANGSYKQIKTSKGKFAFTSRNIANAKKKYGTVYKSKGATMVPAGGRKTRKARRRS